MKFWAKCELVGHMLILLTVGLQFLVIEPINDNFQNDQIETIKSYLEKNKNEIQIVASILKEGVSKPEEFTEEEIVFAAGAVANIESCSSLIIGEDRVAELIDAFAYEVEPKMERITKEEFSDTLDCFLGRYDKEILDSMTSITTAIQGFTGAIIKEEIVKPFMVRFYAWVSWVNFILFIVGSSLSIWARKMELSE